MEVGVKIPEIGEKGSTASPNKIKCCVPTCTKAHGTFYKFPHPERCPRAFHIWLRRIGCLTMKRMLPKFVHQDRLVCEAHFDKNCIRKLKNDRTKLSWGSLPTLKLPNFNGESKLSTWCLAELISAYNNKSAQGDLPKEDLSFLANFDVIKATVNAIPLSNGMEIIINSEPIENPTENTIIVEDVAENQVIGNVPDEPIIGQIQPLQRQVATLENNNSNMIRKYVYPSAPNQMMLYNKSYFAYKKPYFEGLKYFVNEPDKLTMEVCAVCFEAVSEFDSIRFKDRGESRHIRDILHEVLPTFNLDSYQDAVICHNCASLAEKSYELKMKFLNTEKKLKEIVDKSEATVTKMGGNASVFILGSSSNFEDFLKVKGQKAKDVFSEHCYDGNGAFCLERNEDTDFVITGKVLHQRLAEKKFQLQPWKMKTRELSTPFICEICGGVHQSHHYFKRHLERHDKNIMHDDIEKKSKEKPTFLCAVCGQQYQHYNSYRQHLVTHSKPTLKCDRCPKSYHTSHQLKSHMSKVHLKTAERYMCHYCGVELAYKTSLKLHIKVHEGKRARNHQCPICPKKFYAASKLRGHMEGHAGVGFPCEICGKMLKSRSSQQIHVNVFHKGKGGTTCDICQKTYWKRIDLVSHMFKIHDIRLKPTLK